MLGEDGGEEHHEGEQRLDECNLLHQPEERSPGRQCNGYISSKWEGYERSNNWTSSLTANDKFCYLHVGLRTGPQTGVPGTLKCLVVEEENSKKEEETIFQESPRSKKTGTETNIFGIRQNLIN